MPSGLSQSVPSRVPHVLLEPHGRALATGTAGHTGQAGNELRRLQARTRTGISSPGLCLPSGDLVLVSELLVNDDKTGPPRNG